jgi:hypothetical protein
MSDNVVPIKTRLGTPEDVAEFMQKSVSWVKAHADSIPGHVPQISGARKLLRWNMDKVEEWARGAM